MPLQLAEPAIRADCEGLLGRAWQSIATNIQEEVKQRQASTALKALYDEIKTEDNKQHKAGSKQHTVSATVNVEPTGDQEEERSVDKRIPSQSVHSEEDKQEKVCPT